MKLVKITPEVLDFLLRREFERGREEGLREKVDEMKVTQDKSLTATLAKNIELKEMVETLEAKISWLERLPVSPTGGAK